MSRTAMNRSATRRWIAGFTLVEVMIAMSIMFGGLVILINTTASSVRSTQRAQMMGIAAGLARSKMYDLEEELLREGFQELGQSDDGDFADDGWKLITWESEIEKVELPNLGALEALDGQDGQAGQAGQTGQGQGAGADGAEGGALGGMGGSFIASQYELISQILESAIRRIVLKLKWKVAGEEEELTVIYYVTEPKAISQVIATQQAGGDEGGQPPEGPQ